MSNENRFKRIIRGAVRNALVWGTAWAVFTFPTAALVRLTGIIPSSVSLLDLIPLAAKLAILGTICGGVFSLLVSVLYRGKRLTDLNWIKFGAVAGVATAIFIPLFFQGVNVVTGGPILPWSFVTDDMFFGLYGAIAAAGSLRIAQLAEKWWPENREEPPSLIGLERLIERNLGEPPRAGSPMGESLITPRSRAAQD